MRRWRRPGSGDAGYSLVEVLVTTVIAGIVFPLVLGIVITAQQQTSSTVRRAEAIGVARLALQDIDREVRSGDAPLHLDGTQGLGFRTAFTPGGQPAGVTRCVQYRRESSGELRTRTFDTTAGRPPWSTAPVVATGLTPGTSFTAAGGTSSVSVDLVVGAGPGRPATVETVLTARNTSTAAATAACGDFT